MLYKKYQIKNPKIKQMLISLVKHKEAMPIYQIAEFSKVSFIGVYYWDNEDKILPYMLGSLVDNEGQYISLEELIEKILE